ncbi:MAG TPA: carbohydrate binding domain-containing protein, partial [Steroidobacteraceae bacterium]|nr:carbohydrate binding domain-containing protein [Steroidobacteraceae bacterium]
QQQVADFLTTENIATARTSRVRVDLGALPRRSQWDIFQQGISTLAATVAGRGPTADYTLVIELLLPQDQQVFGIEVYILDAQGRNAFSYLLNAHHELFATAGLAATDSSEAARQRMVANATSVAMTALRAQISDARECARRAMVEAPRARAGVVDGFEGRLIAGEDESGTLLGYSTFSGPDTTVSFAWVEDYPPRLDSGAGSTVLRLDLEVTSWGGLIHRFTNAAADRWTPYDWRGLDGFSFRFYGRNSGTEMFFDVFDNRNLCSKLDDAERYRYRFWDDVAGWRLIKARFQDLTRWDVGNDAPDDGLGLSKVHGWALGALRTGEPLAFFIDDLRLLTDAQDTAPPSAQRIEHGPFIETRIGETESRIEVSTGDDARRVVQRVLDLTCACARLTLDRGFQYFRIDEREVLSHERARFRLTFFRLRPADIPVQEALDSGDLGIYSGTLSAAIPAERFLDTCQP